MAENREEILANFQGITNIEDVAEAIFHLEETNWDLLSAINRVMPQDSSSSASQLNNDTHDVEMIDDDISVITPKTHPPDREDSNQASTSSPRNNSLDLVELQVHCNNKIYEMKMSGSATVIQEVKNDLYSLTDIPVRHQRKLLGVYLHHEQSVLSNVFCAQLLGCETVLQTLSANFVLYGWDLTDSHNNNLLLTSITSSLGPVASMTIRSIPVERLPALIIIMRVRSNTEIYSVINGNVGVSELVGGLVEALERFASQKEEDARMERERDARQRVKREQDEAYQMSLEADRAKEEVKKQQELERNQELERAESERQMEEAKKEELRAGAEARVPAEPADGADDVARVRIRLPPPEHGSLERRFHAQDTLAALLDYLASKGYPKENYKVIASWPRRDLTMESPSSTLKALKLFPQETVMLEER
ncbi:jg25220 [Pararge aegeria aegeria]|uniref:Jg25220 protein n=1 Tax=Pararge aegeria aegeria TaxID=348720 RepID=A0A8S4S2T0_9NEOP|nr:jg25220 [Pararge aegeria aegeria]